ncbi:MAG: hypothetical protein IKV88_08930 [Clostridia bacterium]|nr:hypothetical protein [Clostridia bacterium]
MDADEESRSRQYDGTAMSDDEVSKVTEIKTFGIFAKSYIKEKTTINVFVLLKIQTLFLSALCGAYFFDSL